MSAKWVDVGSVGSYFESLSDPRHSRNRKHLLVDIIVIAVCGMICGCEGPTGIHRWASCRHEWLSQYLDLPNGIPSRDCIRRLLMALQPQAFQACFQAWIAAAVQAGDEGELRLVAIDGKTCRRSKDLSKDLGPLHIVSAWASEEGIALGQVATDAKSNEITAIPQLLKQMDLKGTLITIDAMGCQKEIAEEVTRGGGHFVIAVKDNQPTLKKAIEAHFEEHLETNLEDLQYRCIETKDAGHGRIDERSYVITKIPKDWALKKEWPWIKAIGYALRITEQASGQQKQEIRYYMASQYLSSKRFSEAVRQHWGIESMHWVLDVTFREDENRTRERTLANNLSWLRRFAITLLKRHPADESIKGKMQIAGFDPAFLAEVLTT